MKLRTQYVLPAICLGSAVFWSLLWVSSEWLIDHNLPLKFLPLIQLEYYAYDQRVRIGPMAPENPNLVFLGIDKTNYDGDFSEEEMKASPSLQLITTRWPWSREVWGRLIDQLSDAGARVIILDLLFHDPGTGDDYLSQALKRHPGKTVLAANISELEETGTIKKNLVWPSESIAGSRSRSMHDVGLANFWPEPDGVIRSARFQASTDIIDEPLPILATQALTKIGKGDKIPSDTLQHRFRFAGSSGDAYLPRPIYEIFVPKLWAANYENGRLFRNKIVMVGPAGNWSQDLKTTPMPGLMYGPQLHLNTLGAALSDAFIREPDPWQDILLILAGGALAWLILLHFQHPVTRFLLLLFSSLAYIGLCQIIYNQFSCMLPVVAPLLSLTTGGTLCLLHEFVGTLLEKAKTRSALEKYVSHNVVREILDGSGDFAESLGGIRKPCTMLFSDIRSFTRMSEFDDSHALVAQLNEYFTEMVECVFRYEGTLDKFIGDAVMAVWGNVRSLSPEQDAAHAVSCALDMLDSLKTLNNHWSQTGRPPLEIGIGINHGEVLAGEMGSPRRKDITVIGDAVNLASRLEGVTKQYKIPLILGENVATLVKNKFHLQTVDLIRAMGRSRPVDTFYVLGRIETPLTSQQQSSLEQYEQGVIAYRTGKFEEALQLFESASSQDAENTLARLFARRCNELSRHPPGKDWDGVYIMETK
ncbi:MAG: adenylate/guanylate cyclase domain-containing protein [Methylacidiphilales bacterium]|nr:adenylate/guanylate cyclase domain-containing protein [Candidatus Methylacidiphilales bacterium]